MLIDLDDIMINYTKILIYSHCVKSVRIRSYSGSVFSFSRIWIEYGEIRSIRSPSVIIYDICFASDTNYTGRLQIKICFLGSVYHL